MLDESGGGGSSDFSTAEVTVVSNLSETIKFNIPIAFSSTEEEYYIAHGDVDIEPNSTTLLEAILFKRQCSMYDVQLGYVEHTLNISGNIEDDGDNYYIITGDCTITIS